MKKYFIYIFWVYIVMLLIINLIPDLPTPELEREEGFSVRLDYLFHFGLYFAGGILLFHYRKGKKLKRKEVIWLSAFALYAGLNEVVQLIVPGRTFNPIDLAINIISFVMGYLAFYLLRKSNE